MGLFTYRLVTCFEKNREGQAVPVTISEVSSKKVTGLTTLRASGW